MSVAFQAWASIAGAFGVTAQLPSLEPRLDGSSSAAKIVAMGRRAEMRRWLELRERDGLTFRSLSAVSGVPAGTLAHWAWKLRQGRVGGRRSCSESKEPADSDFVELVPTEPTRAPTGSLEIVLAQDRRIVVTGAVDEEQLVRVVRALARC